MNFHTKFSAFLKLFFFFLFRFFVSTSATILVEELERECVRCA